MHEVVRRTLLETMTRHALPRFVRQGAALSVFAVLVVLTTASAEPLAGGVRVALFDDRGATVGAGHFTDASAELSVHSDLAGFLTLVVVRPDVGAAFYDAFVSFDGSLVVVSEAGFEHLDTFVGRLTSAVLTVAIEEGFADDAGTEAWEAWLLPEPPLTAGPGANLRELMETKGFDTDATETSIHPVRNDEDDEWDDDGDWDDERDDEDADDDGDDHGAGDDDDDDDDD